MRLLATIALSGIWATAAVAGPFDGTWDFKEYCTNPLNDTRMTIRGDQAEFYESTCEMANPTALRDMGTSVLYDLQCNGEGETYSGGRMMLSLTEDRQLLIYNRGYVSLKVKC